jgi:hypothetical protein
MYTLLSKLSSLFFTLALWFEDKPQVFPIYLLAPFQKCTFGVFFGVVEKNGIQQGLFANSSIGFFFRDTVFEYEVIEHPFGKMASKQEIAEIKEYLVDKIVEGQQQLEALENGFQPDIQSQ